MQLGHVVEMLAWHFNRILNLRRAGIVKAKVTSVKETPIYDAECNRNFSQAELVLTLKIPAVSINEVIKGDSNESNNQETQ